MMGESTRDNGSGGNVCPSTGRYFELKINSDPANLAAARRTVEAFCGNCRFDETTRGQVIVCVNEALANVMRHAYAGATDRPIVLRVEFADDTLKVSIRDWGSGVNPDHLKLRHRDPMTPGGLGLVYLRQLMDEVIFEPQGDGMLLIMRRRKDSARDASSSDRAVG